MKWLARIVYLALLAFAYYVASIFLAAAGMPNFLRYLAFGWVDFLRRNISEMTINWGLIATGLACSVGMLILAHAGLRLIYKQLPRRPQAPNLPNSGPWRCTVTFYGVLWLLFTIAIGGVGLWQSVLWLSRSNVSLYEIRRGQWDLKIAANAVRMADAMYDGDFEKVRAAVLAQGEFWKNLQFHDNFEVLLFGDADGKVGTFIIIPRNPKLLAQGRFFYSEIPNDEFEPLSMLEQKLAEADAKYPLKASQ